MVQVIAKEINLSEEYRKIKNFKLDQLLVYKHKITFEKF